MEDIEINKTIGVEIESDDFGFGDIQEDIVGIVPKKPFVQANCTKVEFGLVGGKDGRDSYEALKFTFVEKVTHGTWVFALLKPSTKAECQTDDDNKKRVRQLGRLTHLAGAFTKEVYTPKKLSIDVGGKSFKELCEYFIANFDPNFTKLDLTLKIVKNGNNNDFPLFAPFISSSFKKRDFEWDDKYDKLEKEASSAESGSGFSAV